MDDAAPHAHSQTPTFTAQDQNVPSASRGRQSKSAPSSPRKTRRVPQAPIEHVPELKASLESINANKLTDTTHQNLRNATSASTITSLRGQHFTVGNISNGLIYLRPVVRPAHEKHLLLHSTAPQNFAENQPANLWEDDRKVPRLGRERRRENRHPTSSPPRTPTRQRHQLDGSSFYIKTSPPVQTRSHHHRAYSFSTATGRSTPTAPDFEGYRVVIDRVETERPKTAGPQPEPSFDGLQVKIPHYALGSPHFTPHGTPFLHGSSSLVSSSLLVPSTKGEVGSTTGSQITDFKWFKPGDGRANLSSSPIPLLPDRENSPFASPPPSMPSPIRHIPTDTAITPKIFDTLSFPPYSEHPSVVKYDARNKQIVAATPPRIIAQITSATFLDYQLLSDFFLTYRLFMTPLDLAAYLAARLRWAIDRNDDVGRVVRVRTFVAIRHWLLNYFGDDFVPSLTLRQRFVSALNDLSNTVLERGSQSDIKIIGELKKCWRRTCALYWDDSHVGPGVELDADAQLLPGGPPGKRNDEEGLEPPTSPKVYSSRPSTSLHLPQVPAKLGKSGTFDASATKPPLCQFESTKPLEKKTSAKPLFEKKILAKAASDASINKTSANPDKSTKKTTASPFMHPTPKIMATLGSNTQQQPTTPKGKPNTHKRSGSFSDALRDNRQPLPLQNSLARSTHLLMAFPYSGTSLVRGTLLPPTAAYVEVMAPPTPVPEPGVYTSNGASQASSTTGFHDQDDGSHHHHNRLGLGGPGMKRFIDGLKKALSGKAPHGFQSGIYSPVPIPKHGSGSNVSDTTADSITRYTIRSSLSAGSKASERGGTASVGDGRLVRMDLLGAGVVDAFQRMCQGENFAEDVSSDRHIFGEKRSISSRIAYRRATVDTTVGESVFSDFEDKSLVEDYPLSPQTRRRGNTLRAGALRPTVLTPMGERGETPLPSSDKSDISLAHISSDEPTPISLETPKRSSLAVPSKQSHQPQSLKPCILPLFADDGLFGRRSQHSLLSAQVTSTGRRHSENSHMSNFEAFSDTSSLSGIAEGPQDAQPPANRLLRRMPGGLLRKATTVADLEAPARPNSAGTLSTFSQSASVQSLNGPPFPTGPFGYRGNDRRAQKLAAGVVSLGAVAKGAGVHFPLVDTDLTSPPTPTTAKELFEQGVMQLAALADNESDDGGIEVALMKLEGRYDRRTTKMAENDTSDSLPTNPQLIGGHTSPEGGHEDIASTKSHNSMVIVDKPLSVHAVVPEREQDSRDEHMARTKRRHKGVVNQVPLETPPAFDSSTSSFGFPTAEAEEEQEKEKGRPIRSVLPELKESVQEKRHYPPRKSSMSTSGLPYTKTLRAQVTKDSLSNKRGLSLDGSDNISELSSEISFEMLSRNQSPNQTSAFKFPRAPVISELGISSHPLRHPSSPPLTLEQALGLDQGDGLFSQRQYKSDIDSNTSNDLHNVTSAESTPRPRKLIRESISLLQPPSIHLPFILAYDSQLLAKQFTLIEKDALNEIDWKELVELRWKQTSTTVRDWVEFLKSKNVRGVEVIIARFNLMWKWAMSEIVMTKDIDERARTIVKFIHIAAHARKLQNFATMYQITAALLTSNIARLHKTWKLVSAADMETFKQLESLIQPVRNFHNLRVEMDKVTGETGCIPFVGLFTHDLIYNAQRPSHITGPPDGELLVNFEKHRMTASIIKRLLRLAEASHKYDFKAVDGVCERCLWIASLSDDEIKGLSKSLEA